MCCIDQAVYGRSTILLSMELLTTTIPHHRAMFHNVWICMVHIAKVYDNFEHSHQLQRGLGNLNADYTTPYMNCANATILIPLESLKYVEISNVEQDDRIVCIFLDI